jgi:hypothetical protein
MICSDYLIIPKLIDSFVNIQYTDSVLSNVRRFVDRSLRDVDFTGGDTPVYRHYAGKNVE